MTRPNVSGGSSWAPVFRASRSAATPNPAVAARRSVVASHPYGCILFSYLMLYSRSNPEISRSACCPHPQIARIENLSVIEPGLGSQWLWRTSRSCPTPATDAIAWVCTVPGRRQLARLQPGGFEVVADFRGLRISSADPLSWRHRLLVDQRRAQGIP